MKKICICLLVCLSVLTLSACGSKKGAIYNAPDEKQVKENKPLTLPPDYTLRPPTEK